MTRAEAEKQVREEIERLRVARDDPIQHAVEMRAYHFAAKKLQWALDLLTSAADPVAALPGKWREDVRNGRCDEDGLTALDCADELEAALKGGE